MNFSLEVEPTSSNRSKFVGRMHFPLEHNVLAHHEQSHIHTEIHNQSHPLKSKWCFVSYIASIARGLAFPARIREAIPLPHHPSRLFQRNVKF